MLREKKRCSSKERCDRHTRDWLVSTRVNASSSFDKTLQRVREVIIIPMRWFLTAKTHSPGSLNVLLHPSDGSPSHPEKLSKPTHLCREDGNGSEREVGPWH